jgi:hypothetical protein
MMRIMSDVQVRIQIFHLGFYAIDLAFLRFCLP